VSDLDFLLESATVVEELDEPSARHLTSPLALRDYVRLADHTARLLRGTRLLDWGCGYGQMSYLMARRGVDVTSYDVGRAMEDGRVPVTHGLTAVRGEESRRLPFRTGAFDAVLACGVLEHVADPASSLAEVHRVLGPGGRLFVYNLPQRWSYKELAIRLLHLGYSHERRYTGAAIRGLLEDNGFGVVRVSRVGMLPHLATGLSPRARRIYYRASTRLASVDRLLSHAPILNRVAQSLEVVADRR